MSSNSEKGHAKNVGQFQVLIANVESYDTDYQPSNEQLLLTELQALCNDASAIIREVAQAKVADDAAITARQEAFEPIKKLATRIINSLASCGASAGTVEHARVFNRKLQSAKTLKKTTADTPPEGDAPTPHSDSQRSFDNLIQHFSNIVDTVAAELQYDPKEAALKTTTLQLVVTGLKNANKEAITTQTALNKARSRRDALLYHPENGLVPIAIDTKAYVLSLFGRGSNEYKSVGKLRFTTPGDVRFVAEVPEAAGVS